MKSKIIISILIIFILTSIIFASISKVQASVLGNSIASAENFANSGKSDVISYKNLYNVISYLYNIAMTIGIILSIIIGMVLGFKIILGSIDERADAKHLLVPYLVIVGMIAFGFTIWKIVLNLIHSKI